MTPVPPSSERRLPAGRIAAAAVVACLLLIPVLAVGAQGRAASAARPRAHAANAYLTGLGDEHADMFSEPLYTQLHTKIVRYIAGYDDAVHPYFLQQALAFIHAAEGLHEQVLVAFYHSEYTPTKLPSVATYQKDVAKFIKYFPNVHQYESYDEANRGNERGVFSSPSAKLAAQYYQALLRVCNACTAIGLDVLDAANIHPTLTYISEFKREIRHLRTVMPSIWGLHNYSDVNRFETWRTRDIVKALGGQVWLTETGGIVQFGGSFPNRHREGLTRAAKALKLMFAIAGSDSRIKRLYIYDWTGGNTKARFDAGLMDDHDNPRPGYVVVCRQLHAAKCNVKVSTH